MKKIILLLFTIVIILIVIMALFIFFEGKPKVFETHKNISMIIDETTLTNKGATIIITDLSGDDNTYGSYSIYQLIDDKWKKLDYIVEKPVAEIAMGYRTNKDGILKMKINWEYLYGPLKPGKYRVVVEARNKHIIYVFTEFNID